MANALEFDVLRPREVNAAYADLLAGLAALPKGSETTLNIENSLWIDEGFELHDAFAETDRRSFGAQLETLDLQGDVALGRINGWVADRTNDKITDLIDEIPDDVVIYLINAVYFKSDWAVPFEPGLTAEEPFSIAADDRVDVPMMRRDGQFMYVEAEGTQAVRLPYADGRLAMWVVLPPNADGDPRDAANAGIAHLATGGWKQILTEATDRSGSVVMPTFTTRTKTDLASALKALGMPLAFDPGAADFSEMSPQGADLFVSRVLHETYVSVDEQGTEAAAATAVEGQVGAAIESPPTQEPFEMRVDRPFLFVIEDSLSGAPLFLGVIEDPR
jgi:serpin B